MGNNEIKEELRLRVYNFFLPTLLYTTENLTLPEKQKSTLQASEMRFRQLEELGDNHQQTISAVISHGKIESGKR